MLFVSFFFISKIWWQVLRLMGFFWDRVALKRAELVNPYPCPCPCQLWSILDSLYQVLPSFIKSFWSSFFGSLQFLKSFWSSQRLSMWSSFQLLFVFVYFDSFEFLADFFQFLGLFESFNLFSTRRDRLNLFSVGSFGFFWWDWRCFGDQIVWIWIFLLQAAAQLFSRGKAITSLHSKSFSFGLFWRWDRLWWVVISIIWAMVGIIVGWVITIGWWSTVWPIFVIIFVIEANKPIKGPQQPSIEK